jgi:short-subunit dehydrogenase
MRTPFDNRVIWLTGASSGIGEALARRLHEAGARLILSSRNEAALQRVAVELGGGERISVLPLDLERPETLAARAEKALAVYGGLDMLINNAGIGQRDLAEHTILDVDRRIMEIDYFGPVALSKFVLPHFLQRRRGHFVVISSMAGKIGAPMRSAYAAAKHALYGFFESLRAEVANRGVLVTMVCPGFIHTNFSLHALCGDGRNYGVMDSASAHGMPPLRCADRILRAVAEGRSEVYVGGKELSMIYLYRWLPDLHAWLMPHLSAKQAGVNGVLIETKPLVLPNGPAS